MPGSSANGRRRRAQWLLSGFVVAVDVADEALGAQQQVEVLARPIVDEHEAAQVEAVDEVVGDAVRRPCPRAARRRLISGSAMRDVIAGVGTVDGAARTADSGREVDQVVAVAVDDRQRTPAWADADDEREARNRRPRNLRRAAREVWR